MMQIAKTIALSICLLFIAACSGQSSDQIARTWRDYASAVSRNQGAEAVKLASENTLRHYAMIGRLALKGGQEMRELTLYDEVSVFYLRHVFEANALRKFTGRDIMRILVKNELAGIPKMNQFQLADIDIEGDRAWANLYTTDLDAEYRVSFVREGGKWKIEGKSLNKSRDDVLIHRMMSYASTRDDVIDELLKSVGVRGGLTPELMRPLSR